MPTTKLQIGGRFVQLAFGRQIFRKRPPHDHETPTRKRAHTLPEVHLRHSGTALLDRRFPKIGDVG
ncbi:MAG: hypothetical protein ABEL51_10140, partial [Salinibacter sp.]